MNVINREPSSHKLYNNYNLDIGGVCITGYNNTAKLWTMMAIISCLKGVSSFVFFTPFNYKIFNLKE